MYKHKLLIASPMLTDPIFSGKVVFVFEHAEKGAQGVILNSAEIGKVGFTHMKDLFNAAPGSFSEVKNMILSGDLQSVPLYMGGPCHTPGIFFLHGHEELLTVHEMQEQDSEYDLGIPTSFNIFDEGEKPAYQDNVDASPIAKLKVIDGLYFGSPYTFGHLVENGKLGENKFKFFSGMSVWGSGQLDYEVENGAWTIVDPTPNILFNIDELNKLVPNSNVSTSKHPWLPKIAPGYDPLWN